MICNGERWVCYSVTPYLKDLDAVNPMDSDFHNALSAGITGVMAGPGSSNVVGGQFVFIKTHRRWIDKMVVLEPAAMKIEFGENIKSNYNKNNMMPTTRMSIGSMLREELFEAKQYNGNKKNAKQSGNSFDPIFLYNFIYWIKKLSYHNINTINN